MNKDHPDATEAGRSAKGKAEKADSANAGQVQDRVDVETEQGFRGVEVDQTPNEAYTVAGVTSGQPTPETDPDAAAEAAKGQKAAEAKAAGVGER
jgi:hypothetical protein